MNEYQISITKYEPLSAEEREEWKRRNYSSSSEPPDKMVDSLSFRASAEQFEAIRKAILEVF